VVQIHQVKFVFLIKNKPSINLAHALNENKNESDLSKNVDNISSPTNPSKSTQKSATLEFSQVPKKYRRRPLTQDEIDLVTV